MRNLRRYRIAGRTITFAPVITKGPLDLSMCVGHLDGQPGKTWVRVSERLTK